SRRLEADEDDRTGRARNPDRGCARAVPGRLCCEARGGGQCAARLCQEDAEDTAAKSRHRRRAIQGTDPPQSRERLRVMTAKPKAYDSVWHALAKDEAEAETMRLRADLA